MKIEKYSIISVFILSFSLSLFAQQPLNLGFEKKSVEGINRPWGLW